MLAKINDNAYSIDIPIAEFGGVSNSFNVADLSPYDGEDLGASRSTPFEGGGEMMRTSIHLTHLHLMMMISKLLQRSPMMKSELVLLQELVQSY